MHTTTALALFVLAVSASACSNQGSEFADDITSVPSESSAVEETSPTTEETIVDAMKEEKETVYVARKKEFEGAAITIPGPDAIDGVPTEEPVIDEIQDAIQDVPAPEEPAAVADTVFTPSDYGPVTVYQPPTYTIITQLGATMEPYTPPADLQSAGTANISLEYTPPPSKRRSIDCEQPKFVDCP